MADVSSLVDARRGAFRISVAACIALAASVVVPPAIVVVLVARYAVNVPFGDQWELLPLIEGDANGAAALPKLWEQHNEHRVAVAKVVMLELARLSAWNVVWEQFVGIAVAMVTWILIVMLARRTLSQTAAWARHAVVIASAWLVFSLAQWENWLWGWQLTIFLNALAAAIAAAAVARRARGMATAWVAVAAGVLATLSFANGLALLWLALLAARPRRGTAVATVATAGVVSAVYLSGYHPVPWHPSPYESVRDPLRFITFCFAYLGSPFGQDDVRAAAAVGVVGFAMFAASAWCVWRQGVVARGRALPWLLLGGYIVVSTGVTALGRACFGIDQALASRYTTFSSLFWIATLAMTALAFVPVDAPTRGASLGALVLGAALAFAYGVSYHHGYVALRARGAKLRAGRACALKYRRATADCLQTLHPNVALLRERLAVLERLRLGPFHARSRPAGDR